MYPLAVVMGVPPSDAAEVGLLLGLRTLATEIPAYKRLAELTGQGAMSPRSVVISAYALCGFAHVSSMAIFVGGIAAIAPERRKDLAREVMQLFSIGLYLLNPDGSLVLDGAGQPVPTYDNDDITDVRV